MSVATLPCNNDMILSHVLMNSHSPQQVKCLKWIKVLRAFRIKHRDNKFNIDYDPAALVYIITVCLFKAFSKRSLVGFVKKKNKKKHSTNSLDDWNYLI